ncbi:epoxide hydrolase 4 isoform X2 [Rosa chinensis]|uniref:epoxide hydrolase 4 isoform X2 n=1 Tax=Rosa chinensis TaxID=74649 RepID=UPI001AD9126F|nr:epoxide hydrolase 4 isoform X2 [Rosa chinensis]
MGNIFAIYKPILHGLMKLAGVRPQTLEIEPGTVMNFWVPTETNSKKSKPAVVFLHGFAEDGIMTWQFQVLSLARYYAVYVPDLIFFGGSITDKPHRSPEFQAECVAKGLRKLGVERCTLVGLSYGGMVGFKMAELYPDLVAAFVVTCSVMALNESVSDAGLGRIGFSRWSDYLLPGSVKGAMFDNRREREELLEALVISDEDFTVANYPQRVYLLWGANDKIFDIESASNLNKQLGNNASVYHIEKAGHLVQLERPFVYNSQLKKFLASLSEDVHQD